MHQGKMIYFILKQDVSVRKNTVNCESLCSMLRSRKKQMGISNNQIAETLDVPLTMVQHWFRQDKHFSIPDHKIWFQLKDLLKICTDEFDEQITEFDEKLGVFDKAERVYSPVGVYPTMTRTNASEKVITVVEISKEEAERITWKK